MAGYEVLEPRDRCYGVVTGGCSKGVFLTLEDGQEAFAYFGTLPVGTWVFCNVRRLAAENRRMLVSIDGTIWTSNRAV